VTNQLSNPIIIVHGGATVFKEQQHPAILGTIEAAAKKGLCIMENGGSSLDAVEASTWILEDSGLFTAGGNSPPNRDGVVELDAAIMDGSLLKSGGVMAVRDVFHPISLARYILERTAIMQIAGDGAKQMYKEMVKSGYRKEITQNKTESNKMAASCDTVGSVALDEHGRIAVSSSTSGWPGKIPGRVGDTPIIGSGLFANEMAGASCTGRGEQILRVVMARMAVYHVENGTAVQEAVSLIMRELREKTSGEAGLIMLDNNGTVGFGFDTPHMPIAVAQSGVGEIYSSMKPNIDEFVRYVS
jgi:beta-aspartyl-peptidase (threonine type)